MSNDITTASTTWEIAPYWMTDALLYQDLSADNGEGESNSVELMFYIDDHDSKIEPLFGLKINNDWFFTNSHEGRKMVAKYLPMERWPWEMDTGFAGPTERSIDPQVQLLIDAAVKDRDEALEEYKEYLEYLND